MWPLFVANLKMMVRNRQALFWALIFPLIFIVIFGLFDMDNPGSRNMVVIDNAKSPASQALVQSLGEIQFLEIDKTYTDETSARAALSKGKVDYVLIVPEDLKQVAGGVLGAPRAPVSITLVVDQSKVQSNQLVTGVLQQWVDEVNLQMAGAPKTLALTQQSLQARKLGYMNFLVPGIVGMGVMTYSIAGISVAITRYREQKILKRIMATPLPRRNFFVAEILAHLVISVAQAAIILAAARLLFGIQSYGNYLWIFVLVMFANTVFLNIGFIVAALSKTSNAADGMANAVSMPMMFLSGAFSPTTSLPHALEVIVRYLPLTPLLDALRKISVDGSSITATWSEIGILGIWIVVTSVLAVKLFRFE